MNRYPRPVPSEYGVDFRIDAARVVRWLFKGGLALLILASGMLALFWVYQVNTYVHRLNIGDPTDAAYLKGFTAPVLEAGLDYRWTGPQAWAGLNYPSAPFEVTFRAWAARPDNRPVEVEVTLAGKDRRLFALDDQPREYILRSRQILLTPEGLEIAFRPLSTFTDEQGREVGIQLDWLEVRQASSRFGPTIPPPFVGLWWLLTGLLPLVVVRLTVLPFKSGLLLCAVTFISLNFLYILPSLTALLRERWLIVGAIFWLVQLLILLLIAYLVRLKHLKQKADYQPLQLPALVWAFWLLIGFLLLYISINAGRLLNTEELAALATGSTWAQLQLTTPIDGLLPDPPPGSLNLPFSNYGAGYSFFVGLAYRLAQRGARALPYFFSQPVGASGLVAYFLPFLNILLASCTIFLFYRLVCRLGARSGTAFAASLLLGIATAYGNYGRSFWPDIVVGWLLLYSVAGALFYRIDKEKRTGWLLVSGGWFGLLATVQPAYLLLAPVFLIYFSLVWREAAFSLPELRQAFSHLSQTVVPRPPSVSFRPAVGASSGLTFQPGISDAPRKREKPVKRIPLLLLLILWLLPGLAAFGLASWYNSVRFGSPWQFQNSLTMQATILERVGAFGWWGLTNPPLLLGLLALFKLSQSKYASLKFLVVGLTLVGFLVSLNPLETHLLPFVPLWLVLATPLIEQAFVEHLSIIQLATILVALAGAARQIGLILENNPPFAQTFYTETALAQFTSLFHSASWFALAAWLAFGILLYKRARK